MQKLTNSEIEEIEKALAITLPLLYRKLLIEEGYGSYGQRADCKWNTTKELYHPQDIRILYADFFVDETLLFSPFFPFGCNNDTQDLWIIDATREMAASVAHDVHPDDWPEMEWMSYEDWCEKFL